MPMIGTMLVGGSSGVTSCHATPTSGRLDEAEGSSSVNAAWVVSDFANGPTATITFTLEVAAGSGDDDLIGFVFAYEDSDNFYLLDWKKATQSFNWGDPVVINDDTAEQGLKIKRIDNGWTLDGLWGGQDGLGVTTIAGPAGGAETAKVSGTGTRHLRADLRPPNRAGFANPWRISLAGRRVRSAALTFALRLSRP